MNECGIRVADEAPPMRVRITGRPPANYGSDADSLRVGGVYNLDSAFASALMAEGCADLFELLPDHEKERSGGGSLWQAPGRERRRFRAYSRVTTL